MGMSVSQELSTVPGTGQVLSQCKPLFNLQACIYSPIAYCVPALTVRRGPAGGGRQVSGSSPHSKAPGGTQASKGPP